LAKVLSLTRSEKGSFLACALFSNWGVTLGGFICFLLYGKEGLYLSSWYIVFCRFYHYFIGLPILSLYTDRRRNGLLQTIGGSLSNPLWYVPLIFMISGLLLNLSGVGRPHAVDYLTTKWLVFITAAGYSFTIGLGAHFKESVKYVKLALFAALIKFFYNPLAAYAVLLFLGYFKRADFLPAHVVMTESFMPTAIISVVMVNLLDLNEDTANAIWFFTTIVVIPVVFSLMFIYGSK
jgi:predicted permease